MLAMTILVHFWVLYGAIGSSTLQSAAATTASTPIAAETTPAESQEARLTQA